MKHKHIYKVSPCGIVCLMVQMSPGYLDFGQIHLTLCHSYLFALTMGSRWEAKTFEKKKNGSAVGGGRNPVPESPNVGQRSC